MDSQPKKKFNFRETLKNINYSINYKDFLRRGHLYCATPKSVTVASAFAATSWAINYNCGVGPIFEKPLTSIICIGIATLFTDFCASAIYECIHDIKPIAKPIVPIMLFGSSAYYLMKTYTHQPCNEHINVMQLVIENEKSN
jgi:hypothetical protein